MTAFLTNRWVHWVMRLAVGGVFIYYGGPKLWDPNKFADQIGNYALVPWYAVNVMALILPCVELIAGVVVIVGPWRREAAALIGCMLVAFIIAITSAIVRGLSIDCGCTATGGSAVSWKLVAFDSALLILSILLIATKPATIQATTPTEESASS